MAAPKTDGPPDLKAIIKIAKSRGQINFAMAPGKKDGLVIETCKIRDPKKLKEVVKKTGDAAKTIAGTISVSGSQIVLNTEDKVTPTMIRALRELLSSQKIGLKPVAGEGGAGGKTAAAAKAGKAATE